MIGELIAQRRDIEHLKNLLGRALRVGAVEIVDAERGFRIKLGENAAGEPYLSPWYPHPESGGATSTWAPLSKGQVVGVMNPGGDPRQGLLIRGGFSDANPAPSRDLGENVFSFGGVTIRIGDGGDVSVTAPGKVVVMSPQIELGGDGGRQVARVGDRVAVTSGSSAGLWPIVSGSEVVRSI